MIKKSLLTLALALSLVGCSQPTQPATLEEPTTVVDHGDHVHEVPVSEAETLVEEPTTIVDHGDHVHEVPVSEAGEITEESVVEESAPVGVATGDVWDIAMSKMTDDAEYFAGANFVSDVTYEGEKTEYYYSVGINNSEKVDCVNTSWWYRRDDGIPNRLPSHYVLNVDGVNRCAKFDGDTLDWKTCADAKEAEEFYNFWKNVTVKGLTADYEVEGREYFDVAVSSKAIPWVNQFLRDELIEGMCEVNLTTGEFESVRFELPTFVDNNGLEHRNATVTVYYDLQDCPSGSPIGFEEAIGLNE